MQRLGCFLIGLAVLTTPTAALAARATLVIDADTGKVLSATNANQASFPASLTKLMTVYLLLESIDQQHLAMHDKVTVSAQAASQQPVKLGLKPGDTLSVEELLWAIIHRSANDAAVVAAEAIAGSERAFAERMNAKAHELSMGRTSFRNASGLPHPHQFTTARDMALLARALRHRFPQFYPIFSTSSMTLAGKSYQSLNGFLPSYPGATGAKTGFTCKAGYNLVAFADRDKRRLIGVVLGEPTRPQRRTQMINLFNSAFAQTPNQTRSLHLDNLLSAPDQGASVPLNNRAIALTCKSTGAPGQSPKPKPLDWISDWTVEIGRKPTRRLARSLSNETLQARASLKAGRAVVIPLPGGRQPIFRACITGITQKAAVGACYHMHRKGAFCRVLDQKTASLALKLAELRLDAKGNP